MKKPTLPAAAHNLKAVGSNPTPATNFSVQPVDALKNLRSNLDVVARLAGVLDELGKRISEVGRLLHPSPALSTPQGMTLLDLVNEMLMAKAAKGVRDSYLVQLRHAMIRFSDGHHSRPIDSFKPTDIEAWILEHDWAPATRRSYFTDVCTLFNFAVKRGYLERAPTDGVDKPMLEDTAPGIHTPEQVRQILHTAQATDKDVMRLLAIQYFAGIRPREASRLEEKHLRARFVEIIGPKAKSRKRRLVAIEPALRSFLDAGGTLPVINLKRRWLEVRRQAGVAWSPDVTRHSFASYHLAQFQSADKTAHEMGHRSTTMLFANYRELVEPAQAEKFWAIRPQ